MTSVAKRTLLWFLMMLLSSSILCAQGTVVPPEAWHYLLTNDQIRGELEITKEQRIEIKRMEERLDEMVKLDGPADPIAHFFVIQRLKSLAEPNEMERAQLEENRRRVKELNEKWWADIDSGVQSILLPFQIERLNQLTSWQMINEQGYAAFLEWIPIRKQLELSGQQSDDIKEMTEKHCVEFQRELDELRARYREKLNGVLTSEQVQKVKDIIGEYPNSLDKEKVRY